MNTVVERATLGKDRPAAKRRRWWVAYLLWAILGAFGAHRFYLGRTGTAKLQLILLLGGFLTVSTWIGVVLLPALIAWVLVDGLLIPFIMARDARIRCLPNGTA